MKFKKNLNDFIRKSCVFLDRISLSLTLLIDSFGKMAFGASENRISVLFLAINELKSEYDRSQQNLIHSGRSTWPIVEIFSVSLATI